MEENRKYKRITLIGAAEVRDECGGALQEAHTISMGYGGVAFYVQRVPEGQVQIRLFYRAPGGGSVSETVQSHVVWQKPVGSWYAVGVQFEGLDPEVHPLTIDYLHRATGSIFLKDLKEFIQPQLS